MRRHPSILLALSLLPALGACAQSVDCREAPERCLPAARARSGKPAPNLAPREAPAPKVATPEPAAAPSPPPPQVANLLRKLPVAERPPSVHDMGLAAPAERPPNTAALRAQAGEPANVLRGLLPALRKHDFEGVKPFLTERLRGALEQSMPTHAERYWRHMDNYVRVLGGEHQVEVQPAEDGRTPLIVKNTGGDELKPILVKEGDLWKIDRF